MKENQTSTNKPSKNVNQPQGIVEDILNDQFNDQVYSVEDGHVWISEMNQHYKSVAQRIVDTLVHTDIPCNLIDDDNATRFNGVQFQYEETA